MPQWLSGWIEHMALFFSTLGARIRRIGPRARTVMRESRARNFPESNRFLVQVFLVIGGMFPMWRSLLHERVMAHRRQRSHAAGEHEDRWRRQARRVNPFYFIGGAAGSLISASAWQHAGWTGVCAIGAIVAAINLLVWWRGYHRQEAIH